MISFQFSSIFLCPEMMFGLLHGFNCEVPRKHGAEHVVEELVQRYFQSSSSERLSFTLGSALSRCVSSLTRPPPVLI